MPKLTSNERRALGVAVAAGLALFVIGVRFSLVPHQAARFFGISTPPGPFDLHQVIALRDLWIALLMIALAMLREWRALAICMGLGVLVCFGDAMIVGRSSGSLPSIAFHVASGFYCAGAAVLAWRVAQRTSSLELSK